MKNWTILVVLLALAGLFSLPGSVDGKSFSQVKREFYKEYNTKDYSKRMLAVQKLADTRDIRALKLIVNVVLKVEPDQYVFDETLKMIQEKFNTPKAKKYLGSKMARHSNWKIQLVLCRMAKDLRGEAIVEGLIRALKDSKDEVRTAAITSLRAHRNKKAIPELIDRLSREDGRLKGELVRTLKSLTGVDLGDSESAWKSWWQANKANFSVPSSSSTSNSGENADQSKVNLGTVLREKKNLYGSVFSNKVVFILDISGSMLAGTEGGKRIDVAKAQLKDVIDKQLDRKSRFNIIAYNTKLKAWKRRITRATSSNKRSAKKWIDSLKVDPNGMTATYDALEAVFKYNKRADTIYLLSDGQPTAGQVVGEHQILSKIRTMNRFRNLAIHAIAFMAGTNPGEDQKSAVDFMKNLAKENNGRFKLVE